MIQSFHCGKRLFERVDRLLHRYERNEGMSLSFGGMRGKEAVHWGRRVKDKGWAQGEEVGCHGTECYLYR